MAPILQRLREDGFTIVKEWMRKMRPQREAFSKVTFAQGELAQLD